MWQRIITRTTGAASADGPSHTLFFWLVGAFLLTLLPHVTQLPLWLTVSILLAIGLRCVGEWKRWPLPTSTSTGVVALCLLAAIYLQFNTVLGRDAGTPFMAGLLTIKFFELRGTRDITLIIFSSFFVVMSALLFSQAIELFVYCLIMMWLLTGILLRTYLGDHSDNTLLHMLRGSSTIFLQALPLALILFFFLPRYEGRFALTLNDAVTGLSDRVDPGSIARLSQDDLPAMRVYFTGNTIPLPESMYWRAIVLWYFDGRSWTRVPPPKGGNDVADLPEKLPAPAKESDRVEQTIILWPQNRPWLPALDQPIGPAEDPDTDTDISDRHAGAVLVLHNNQPVDYKRRYQLSSTTFAPMEKPSPELTLELTAARQLPAIDRIDPRVVALAATLDAPGDGTLAYIHAVLHYFRMNGFQLTTEPGELNARDPVADFLFRTKKGFCEHYASAFGELMRLRGFPTRMVVGYRGGEYDSYGGFYIVNQSNAHAWDEVWVKEKSQWQRVDPTTIISAGSSEALAANAGLSNNDDVSFQLANHRYTVLPTDALPHWMRDGVRDLQMRRQEMEAQWDDWVFSYDPNTQDKMARALGLGLFAKWILLAACLLLIALGGFVAAFLLARRKPLPPVEKFYARLCRRMAQNGAPREPWEGPLGYTRRLAGRFPEREQALKTAGWLVAEYRYSPVQKTPPDDLENLLAAVSEEA